MDMQITGPQVDIVDSTSHIVMSMEYATGFAALAQRAGERIQSYSELDRQHLAGLVVFLQKNLSLWTRFASQPLPELERLDVNALASALEPHFIVGDPKLAHEGIAFLGRVLGELDTDSATRDSAVRALAALHIVVADTLPYYDGVLVRGCEACQSGELGLLLVEPLREGRFDPSYQPGSPTISRLTFRAPDEQEARRLVPSFQRAGFVAVIHPGWGRLICQRTSAVSPPSLTQIDAWGHQAATEFGFEYLGSEIVYTFARALDG